MYLYRQIIFSYKRSWSLLLCCRVQSMTEAASPFSGFIVEPTKNRQRLILDTDVAFDDAVAIASLLATTSPSNAEEILVSTVGGVNTAHDGCFHLRQLFPSIIEVVEGLSSRELPNPNEQWIKDFRPRFSKFCHEWCPKTPEAPTPTGTGSPTASQRVQKFLEVSTDRSVDLICLGPLTNIADWMDTFGELVTQKVDQLWILGGDISGDKQEFNLAFDSKSARVVLRHPGLRDKLRLVPGSETGSSKVENSKAYINSVVNKAKECQESNLLAKLILEEANFGLFYDPILCFLYLTRSSTPTVCQWDARRISFDHETGRLHEVCIDVSPCQVATSINFSEYRQWIEQCLDLCDQS